jgi:hypothetical protein
MQLEISALVLNLYPSRRWTASAMPPWLPEETRGKLYAISNQTLWILFIALWFIQPLNSAFWDVVYTLSSWLGVEPHLGYVGYKTFRFWEHSAF